MKKNKRRLFIITGMSGAGKSQALKIFGDFGFYCVDNLPLALFKNFMDYVTSTTGHENIALGMDMREGDRLKDLPNLVKTIKNQEMDVKVIFLDASDECLIRRFSETKHRHPIHKKLAAAITHEREALRGMRTLADKVIDTSDLKLGELKEKLSILNMGLENRLNEYASNLPGGKRQTLSLIMATLTDYEVLLLDEITASLDQNTSSLVVNITQNIAKQDDKVCLAITHDQLNKESKL